MQLFSALKPYSILRLTIPLVAGIFLFRLPAFGLLNLLSVHFGVMAVLFVALLWMLRTCAYRYRWLFGGTVSLFLLVLGSTVTQIQWDKINCDWSSEKKVYRGVVQETPVEKEKSWYAK